MSVVCEDGSLWENLTHDLYEYDKKQRRVYRRLHVCVCTLAFKYKYTHTKMHNTCTRNKQKQLAKACMRVRNSLVSKNFANTQCSYATCGCVCVRVYYYCCCLAVFVTFVRRQLNLVCSRRPLQYVHSVMFFRLYTSIQQKSV